MRMARRDGNQPLAAVVPGRALQEWGMGSRSGSMRGNRSIGGAGRREWWRVWMTVGLGLGLAGRLQAVVVFGSGDPDRNTEAPTGRLTDSGWQWTGRFGAFCGVPVGPSSFITARHIGGAVGDRFELGGRSYRAVGFENDPESDLRVWHVVGGFGERAPLATAEVEVGEGVVMLGRGGRRGEAVLVDRGAGPVVAGWRWGELDGRLRWGTNRVGRLVEGATVGLWGPLVGCRFDGLAGADEGSLTVGDSGGPMFRQRAGEWELVAVHYAVDSAFSLTADGPGGSGAFFDFRGLYRPAEGGGWQLEDPNSPNPIPAEFFSTRIFPRRAWVEAAVDRAPAGAVLESAGRLDGVFAAVGLASHDPVAREFRVVRGEGMEFFRVTGPAGIRVTGVGEEEGWFWIRYE